ncbi:MAG: MFS transporter, partial [Cupriavidus sp.]|nr:MFS transporter [Cupriavidus sp.]
MENLETASGTPSARLLALAGAYTVVMSVLNVLPMLVPAIMARFHLQAGAAGMLLTFELLAIAAVPILLARWAPAFSLKPLLGVGLALATLGDLASMLARDASTMLAVRIGAGLGAGILLLGTNAAMTSSADPVKDYGFVNTVGLVVAVLLCFLMPYANAGFGLGGNFGLLVLVSLAAAAMIYRLPGHHSGRAVPGKPVPAGPPDVSKPKVALLVLALLLVQASYMAGYTFTEALGARLGLTHAQLGSLLAVAQIFAFAGTGAATRMGSRFGIRSPLLVSVALQALCLFGLTRTSDPLWFVGMLFGCTFFYLFSMSYQLGIGAEIEPSGRVAALGGGVLYLGAAAGPLLGG